MTDTEDHLLDRLSGSAKLQLLWQILAACTTWLLTAYNPWFWIPVSCALLAAALSAIEILWVVPRLRRRVWERGENDQAI